MSSIYESSDGDHSEFSGSGVGDGTLGTVDRRAFMRLSIGAAAALGIGAGATAEAQDRGGGRAGGGGQGQQAIPLGNGEHPAFAFQAYPGGTGAML
jgi:hypothetical protein